MTVQQQELVSFVNVSKTFTPRSTSFSRAAPVYAVRDLCLSIRQGETVGLVGESGSGKTTTGRMLARLIQPTTGRILFEGSDTAKLRGKELKRFRQQLQVVFQDSSQSLDSRMTVGALVQEPLVAMHLAGQGERRARAEESLTQVGLAPELFFDRHPGRLSGGQRQRVAIARAMVLRPKVIVFDEPVTALDLSVQAQILNLLLKLQEENNVAYLFIAHDLSVVKQLAHRVAVMYRGEIVEAARAEEFFCAPAHPYSVALLAAALDDPASPMRAEQRLLPQELDTQSDGCVLAGRCWKTQDICRATPPPLAKVSPLHAAACHFPEGVTFDRNDQLIEREEVRRD